MKFESGKEYKTIKKNGEIGIRTFKVEKISRKNKKILISGAINGVYDLFTDNHDVEYINLFFNRNYLNPSAKDIISK